MDSSTSIEIARHTLLSCGLILALGTLAAFVAQRIRIPDVAVFLLAGADRAQLEALMCSHLPLPDLDGQRPSWRTCPYVPENGYGAFRADHLSTEIWRDASLAVTHE